MKKFAFVFGLSACIALNLVAPLASHAATSTPAPSTQHLNDRLRQQINDNDGKMPDLSALPTPRYPSEPLHVVYLLAVNKRGQVSKVIAGTPCKDDQFNTLTYGNSLQMFLRGIDGAVTSGVFQVTYDYSPTTKRVKRDVSLIKPGGVDPNAPGAVEGMLEHSAPHATSAPSHK